MLGPQDIWVALALGVFFFGAKKLPELSRSLGQAMSEFRKGVSGAGDPPRADPPSSAVEPAAAPAADADKPASAATGERTG
jgi:TatA/E family protein of Tat protein translocase